MRRSSMLVETLAEWLAAETLHAWVKRRQGTGLFTAADETRPSSDHLLVKRGAGGGSSIVFAAAAALGGRKVPEDQRVAEG
jgi:hypothetical protein